jgi:tetratricopeptide (TPR) repeat protein
LASAALALAAGSAASAQEQTLTLPEARSLAYDLMRFGHLPAAEDLLTEILAKNPDDSGSLFLRARIAEAKGDPAGAKRAAARVFRLAEDDRARFAASEIAARSAFRSGSYTNSQLWLRRAYEAAPDEVTRNAVADDYRQVRAINPLWFSLKASVAPSSNVNDGSSDDFNEIAGVDAVGLLSGSAKALEGVEARLQFDLRYRLAQGKQWRNSAIFRHYERRVELSADAQEQAPDLENDDFDQTTMEAGLRHEIVSASGRTGAALTLTGGRTWYGQDSQFDFARGDTRGWIKLTDALRFSAGYGLELRRLEDRPEETERYDRLSLGLSYGLSVGTISGTLHGQISDPRAEFQDGHSIGFSMGYAHEKPILGMELAGQLGVSEAHYSDYVVGIIEVPGGRQDTSYSAGLTMSFSALDYAGFVPEVAVTAESRSSNVSRFDTEEVSVRFGISSAF